MRGAGGVGGPPNRGIGMPNVFQKYSSGIGGGIGGISGMSGIGGTGSNAINSNPYAMNYQQNN